MVRVISEAAKRAYLYIWSHLRRSPTGALTLDLPKADYVATVAHYGPGGKVFHTVEHIAAPAIIYVRDLALSLERNERALGCVVGPAPGAAR